MSHDSNHHQQYVMVNQFLQIQLKTWPSQRWRNLDLGITRLFDKNNATKRNIVQ